MIEHLCLLKPPNQPSRSSRSDTLLAQALSHFRVAKEGLLWRAILSTRCAVSGTSTPPLMTATLVITRSLRSSVPRGGGPSRSLLPMAPASVLDVGAGTGFLSLMALELGHHVTAVDLSSGMLGRLRAKAEEAGLQVEIVEAEAASVPPGPFDAVISRHLLWTLPEPLTALRAWRDAAPQGRLVLVDRLWGEPASSTERVRRWAGRGLARARRTAPAHHAPYTPELRAALPLARGASLESLLHLVSAAGWASPRIRQLTDVDWATRRGLPWPERALIGAPEVALVAGA